MGTSSIKGKQNSKFELCASQSYDMQVQQFWSEGVQRYAWMDGKSYSPGIVQTNCICVNQIVFFLRISSKKSTWDI